jgi:hypothetical protein
MRQARASIARDPGCRITCPVEDHECVARADGDCVSRTKRVILEERSFEREQDEQRRLGEAIREKDRRFMEEFMHEEYERAKRELLRRWWR